MTDSLFDFTNDAGPRHHHAAPPWSCGRSPIDVVLSRLPDATKSGARFKARCPAHDDRRPSLSFWETSDGGVALKCHAGCEQEAVLDALGLTWRDLKPPRDDEGTTGAAKNPPKPQPKPGDVSVSRNADWKSNPDRCYPTAEEAAAAYHRGEPSQFWPYDDVQRGIEIGRILRWNEPTGKVIRPIHFDGTGWRLEGMPSPCPLYRLREVAPAQRVFVTEGEKAADALRTVGLVATTSPHGAESARKADWTPLAGKEILIVPDNDVAGWKYGEAVRDLLSELKPAPMVKLLILDGLPEKGDAFDWIEARDGIEPDALRETLNHLADEAPVWPVDLDTDTSPKTPQELTPCVNVSPSVEPFRPFPIDALPQPVRGFVEAGARAIGCDPCFLAVPMLVACAAAIGNSRRMRLKPSWTEPAILWAALVANSGDHKSPALEMALRAIRERQRQAIREYEAALAEYQTRLAVHNKNLTAWKNSQEGGEPPEKPTEPIPWRVLVDDTTIEALGGLLSKQPRGLLMGCDELAGWLGGFERYKSKGAGSDAAKWLEVHAGRFLMIDRKTGQPKTVYIPNASVSIIGGIQPEILKRCLTVEHRANGLSARLLVAWPPRRTRRWTEDEVHPDLEKAISEMIGRLLSLDMELLDDGDPQPRLIDLEADAKATFVRFYNEHAEEQSTMAGELCATWSKLEAYAPRLALVHHLIRWANGKIPPDREFVIDAESMAAGITLVRWFAHEARRIHGMLNESFEERHQRELTDWIRQRGGRISGRDLMRKTTRYGKTAPLAHQALDALRLAGVGHWETEETGGRPAEIFVLNEPDTDTNPENHGKNAPFVNVSINSNRKLQLGERYFTDEEIAAVRFESDDLPPPSRPEQ